MALLIGIFDSRYKSFSMSAHSCKSLNRGLWSKVCKFCHVGVKPVLTLEVKANRILPATVF